MICRKCKLDLHPVLDFSPGVRQCRWCKLIGGCRYRAKRYEEQRRIRAALNARKTRGGR